MTEHVAAEDPTPGYELRIAGHLDEHWSTWFGGMAFIHEKDGTTTLRGALADQAELHGVLAKVRDLGATLISLTPTDGVREDGYRDRAVATSRRAERPS